MDQDPGMLSRPPRDRGHPCPRAVVAVLLAIAVGACQPPAAPPVARTHRATTAAPAVTTPAPAAPTTPVAPTPTTPSPTGDRATPQSTCVAASECFGAPEILGGFDVAAVPEASGLAASRRHPGVLWLLDDGPGTSQVWAVGPDGALLGAVEVQGLDGRDTEALATGPCGGGDPRPCVYVGDIGDNLRRREHVTVHRFVEPDLRSGVPETPVAADVAHLTYPDGPHDAEALLAGSGGALLIVTKAPFDRATGVTGQARVYGTGGLADGVLVDHGPVTLPEPSRPLHSLAVGNVATGADAGPGRVLLRTYDQVLLYLAPDAAAPLHAFPSWPVHEVPSAVEPQSEAVAWAAGGCGYLTAGEQAGEVWSVPCR